MEDVTKIFSYRLKKLRGEKNQNDVARDIGISRATLSYYESGERKPDINTLYALANYYNVSSDYLIGLSDVAVPEIDTQAISQKTGLSQRAISYLSSLNTSQRSENSDQINIHAFLQLKTINILIDDDILLSDLTNYFFINFTHFNNFYFEDDEMYPIDELNLYDNFLHASCSYDYDIFSNALLLQIQNSLVAIRKEYANFIINTVHDCMESEVSYCDLRNKLSNIFESFSDSLKKEKENI